MFDEVQCEGSQVKTEQDRVRTKRDSGEAVTVQEG